MSVVAGPTLSNWACFYLTPRLGTKVLRSPNHPTIRDKLYVNTKNSCKVEVRKKKTIHGFPVWIQLGVLSIHLESAEHVPVCRAPTFAMERAGRLISYWNRQR